MIIVPVSLKEANEFVKGFHRHHKPVVGHKISVGISNGKRLVGVVILSRPVSRELDIKKTIEVSRLVTDGSQNACSMLYGAAARLAQVMGYEKIQTYILDSEPGTSLKAAGWKFEGMTSGGDWNHGTHKGRRTDQPQGPKQRWSKRFHKPRKVLMAEIKELI